MTRISAPRQVEDNDMEARSDMSQCDKALLFMPIV